MNAAEQLRVHQRLKGVLEDARRDAARVHPVAHGVPVGPEPRGGGALVAVPRRAELQARGQLADEQALLQDHDRDDEDGVGVRDDHRAEDVEEEPPGIVLRHEPRLVEDLAELVGILQRHQRPQVRQGEDEAHPRQAEHHAQEVLLAREPQGEHLLLLGLRAQGRDRLGGARQAAQTALRGGHREEPRARREVRARGDVAARLQLALLAKHDVVEVEHAAVDVRAADRDLAVSLDAGPDVHEVRGAELRMVQAGLSADLRAEQAVPRREDGRLGEEAEEVEGVVHEAVDKPPAEVRQAPERVGALLAAPQHQPLHDDREDGHDEELGERHGRHEERHPPGDAVLVVGPAQGDIAERLRPEVLQEVDEDHAEELEDQRHRRGARVALVLRVLVVHQGHQLLARWKGRPLGHHQVDLCGEPLHRAVRVHRRAREVDVELLAAHRRDAPREQGVPAEPGEEGLLWLDGVGRDVQHLCPDVADAPLGRRPVAVVDGGRLVGGVHGDHDERLLRDHEGLPVDLAVGVARQLLDDDHERRHHVGRQPHRALGEDVLLQRARVRGVRGRGAGADVRDEPLGAGAARRVDVDDRLAHGVPAGRADRGLDVAQLDAEAADLHLEVRAADEDELPVAAPAHHVAGLVHLRVGLGAEGVLDELLGGELRRAQVAARDVGAREAQLAGQLGPAELAGLPEHVDDGAVDRAPHRHRAQRAAAGADVARHLALRGPEDVVHAHLVQVPLREVGLLRAQGLAAGDDLPQHARDFLLLRPLGLLEGLHEGLQR
mmetsp:Transcript_33266/g.98805  ORF Transcript_33266/g.98805 Transcript_33266/m.98805 type:complete len:777 (+) Transcript_33266:1386-3716(+)